MRYEIWDRYEIWNMINTKYETKYKVLSSVKLTEKFV